MDWMSVYKASIHEDRTFLEWLQEESQKWREHSFPPEHRTAELQALGIAEESGELCHAVLKRVQGIRGDEKTHVAEEEDAVGDLVIYLAGFCSSRGYNLQDCVATAWYGVASRDWSQFKETGVKVPFTQEEQ